jgi:lipoprotein-anchoring transpeptidase ErfK/SrfK
MPQFPISALSKAGLLFVTMLVVFPTRLNAEPNPVQNPNLPAQTKIVPPQSPAISVPTRTDEVQKPTTGTKVAPASPATGASAPVSTIKPATTNPAVPTVPVKAVTTNPAVPGTPKQPTAAPAAKPGVTAATNQPHVGEVVNLILKLKEKQVYVYRGDKVIGKYPVAIGKKTTPTPTGEWYVMEKITNPGWTNFNTGKLVKPGPKNPMGERWIGFHTDGKDMIGFHGTPDVKSVGQAVSNGCVRMFNKDVKTIFPLVEVGTVVKVVNE